MFYKLYLSLVFLFCHNFAFLLTNESVPTKIKNISLICDDDIYDEVYSELSFLSIGDWYNADLTKKIEKKILFSKKNQFTVEWKITSDLEGLVNVVLIVDKIKKNFSHSFSCGIFDRSIALGSRFSYVSDENKTLKFNLGGAVSWNGSFILKSDLSRLIPGSESLRLKLDNFAVRRNSILLTNAGCNQYFSMFNQYYSSSNIGFRGKINDSFDYSVELGLDKNFNKIECENNPKKFEDLALSQTADLLKDFYCQRLDNNCFYAGFSCGQSFYQCPNDNEKLDWKIEAKFPINQSYNYLFSTNFKSQFVSPIGSSPVVFSAKIIAQFIKTKEEPTAFLRSNHLLDVLGFSRGGNFVRGFNIATAGPRICFGNEISSPESNLTKNSINVPIGASKLLCLQTELFFPLATGKTTSETRRGYIFSDAGVLFDSPLASIASQHKINVINNGRNIIYNSTGIGFDFWYRFFRLEIGLRSEYDGLNMSLPVGFSSLYSHFIF